MIRRLLVCSMFAVAIASGASGVRAQDDTPVPMTSDEAVNLVLGGTADEFIDNLVDDPERLNDLLARTVRGTPIQQFLEGANFRLKAFDNQDATEDTTSLGFSYALKKSIQDKTLREAENPLALSFNFSAAGNVAFDSEVNPADFLETSLDFEVFQFISRADEVAYTEARADALQAAAVLAADVEVDLDNSPEWQAFFGDISENYLKRLGVTVLWEASAGATLESDQNFEDKQYAYGVRGGLVARSWNPDSAFSRFNLFDYPFAALRVLTGTDERFTPSGRAFPVFLVGVDTVDPKDNELRTAILGDDGTFERISAEIAMKSTISRMDEGDVVLSASWRLFREIDAEDAIRAADMHEQAYFALGLEFPQGPFVTYTSGKLPFDQADQQVWELGYQFSF